MLASSEKKKEKKNRSLHSGANSRVKEDQSSHKLDTVVVQEILEVQPVRRG